MIMAGDYKGERLIQSRKNCPNFKFETFNAHYDPSFEQFKILKLPDLLKMQEPKIY